MLPSWDRGVLPDENHPEALTALERLKDDEAFAPSLLEYTDGSPHFSAVVTRDFSDWSVLPAQSAGPFWLRLTKLGSAIRIQYSVDGLSFRMLRLAYFPDAGNVQVGLMCCSPEREGFVVEFSSFRISEPIVKGLHEE